MLYANKILGRKWAIKTICELDRNGVMRYGELKRALEGITNMALTQILKSMIEYDVVNRVQYNEMPPRVEYSLTESGKRILPCLYSIAAWGNQQMEKEKILCTCEYKCFADYYDYLPVEELDDIKHSTETNDVLYQQLYEQISTEDITVKEKIKRYILGTMEILISKGSDNVRYQLTFSFRNDTPSLYREDRVFYQRARDLLCEARDTGKLKNGVEVDKMIDNISKIITGCIGDWQLANCTYDPIEENEDFIQWMCDQIVE